MADLLDNEPQYRVCPACDYRTLFNQPVPINFTLPRDCPRCADARDRALKTIQEVKAAERDAIPPIVTAGSLYCPHCPVSSLKEEQYGENVYIKVCDPYGDDHQGCGYKWVTDARGNSDIFRQQNAMRVANERASLQRTVDQFVHRLRRAGFSGKVEVWPRLHHEPDERVGRSWSGDDVSVWEKS
jgi:hypothetical protein